MHYNIATQTPHWCNISMDLQWMGIFEHISYKKGLSLVKKNSCSLWDYSPMISRKSWWRHQMETFSALLAISTGNSPFPGGFPAQRPVMRSFDVFFDLCLNKRLSKQPWGWWFETLSCPLWRHCNDCLERKQPVYHLSFPLRMSPSDHCWLRFLAPYHPC